MHDKRILCFTDWRLMSAKMLGGNYKSKF